MGVSRFEDLRVWQEAKALCDDVGGLIRRPELERDAPLRDQLNRAVISTMANIAEGFLRGRRKEFIQFLRIASASNGEVRALLHAAEGRRYLSAAECQRLVASTNGIGRMLRRLIETLERPARGVTRSS